MRFPSVWVSVWACCAITVHCELTIRLDHNAAKVSIGCMAPQALQARAEEANVWAALLLV